MSAPRISVILTAHNYGRYLDTSIRSALGQSRQDFELIVVDDGSTDETPRVLERYRGDAHVRVLRLEGVGLAAACNRGIAVASGEYVIRLDADDYFDREILAVESTLLDRQPDVGLVYPGYWRVDEAGRVLDSIHVSRAEIEVLGRTPLAAGAMYRRSCYDAIGGYDEQLRYQEDYDFWLRFTARFPAVGCGIPLLYYRQHAGSMSRNLAPRAAARRYVKRRFVDASGRRMAVRVLAVIPSFLPWLPARDQTLLARPLDGMPLLTRAIRHAQAHDAADCILVVTDDPALLALAASAGVSAATTDDLRIKSDTGVEEIALLAAAVRFVQAGGWPEPDVALGVSPWYPLRHPERVRETLDTLLVQDVVTVVSVDHDQARCWWGRAEGSDPGAWECVSTAQVAQVGVGGLRAAHVASLSAERQGEPLRVGWVELMPQEGLAVADATTLALVGTLASSEAIPVVSRADYLRTL